MALDCPRCKTGVLQEIELGDVPIDRCDTCAGLWFDNDELAQVTGRGDLALEIEGTIPPVEAADNRLACPRCPEVALRRLDVRGVAVYRCVSCAGTWLDRGALSAEEDPGLGDRLRDRFT